MDTTTKLTREIVREAFIAAGNEQLMLVSCPTHGERAYLAAAASTANLVISGCCIQYIEIMARELGLRVDREVKGGRPTMLLSAGLQVL